MALDRTYNARHIPHFGTVSSETYDQYMVRARSYEVQSFYHRQESLFSPVAEHFVVSLYFGAPFNLPKLKQLLDKYDIGAERKKRILNAVVAQIKHAVEGATSLDDVPPPLPSMVPMPEATPTPEATPQK